MRISVMAALAISMCACGGVRSSNIKVGWGEQPVFPLHVHPSLSGKPAPANARAAGRGTRGSPTSLPFIALDYPDPPEFAIHPPEEQPIATSPGPVRRSRSGRATPR
ncbi:MAG: hypothetical protein QM778_16480 [Myxococcales bacterium]